MTTIRHGRTALAVIAGCAIVLSACGGGGGARSSGSDGDAKQPVATTITHTYEQEISTYNANTAEDNAAKNSIVLQRVLTGFWYFGDQAQVVPNEDFGTYEKTSEDPLTVEYSIGQDTTWSDGNPIDCDDILLFWAANSGRIVKGGTAIFSTSSTIGIENVKVPQCAAGDKDFTFEYTEPFADWESTGPGATDLLPAHVAYEQAGLSEDEFIEAVQSGDSAALAKVADYYNTGFIFEDGLPDPSMIPSSGPYKLDEWDPGQSITLVANDKYWADPPLTKTVVIRFISQEEQAQALQNQEVNIVEPQPNPDLVNQFENMQGVKYVIEDQYFYDHLDFNFDSSPFSDRRLREAFAKCVPRQLILDNLIKPLQPEAEVIDLRNVAPFEDNYSTIVQGVGGDKYAEPDIAGAKKLLEDAGKVGMPVKIGYQTPNPRRTQVVELIADKCGEAGFEIKDAGEDTFFEEGGGLSTNTYDVALFGWVSSPIVTSWSSTFRTAPKCTPSLKGNNVGCYSNKKVDRLIGELGRTIVPEEQNEIINQVETLLWKDLATIPLYSNPNLSGWSENLQNIIPNPSSASTTWNMDQWSTKQ